MKANGKKHLWRKSCALVRLGGRHGAQTLPPPYPISSFSLPPSRSGSCPNVNHDEERDNAVATPRDSVVAPWSGGRGPCSTNTSARAPRCHQTAALRLYQPPLAKRHLSYLESSVRQPPGAGRQGRPNGPHRTECAGNVVSDPPRAGRDRGLVGKGGLCVPEKQRHSGTIKKSVTVWRNFRTD